MLIKARYILPIDGPPIENGAIVVEGDRVAAVGPANAIGPRADVDYGDTAILPSFVNAHTHLELSSLTGRFRPSPDLTIWLKQLVGELSRNPPTPQSTEDAVKRGIEESLRCGVSTIGDITRFPGWTRSVIQKSPIRAASFGEVIAIGKHRHLFHPRLRAAISDEFASDRLRIGLSPHAPYTVEPDALAECSRRAAPRNLPLCIHLAETRDEESFTRSRTGPFVDYLKSLGVWDDEVPTSGCSPVELAHRTGLLIRRTLIAHANYVSDSDLELLARSGVSVAYCPRTHHAFGHEPHRFQDMLAAGVNVCIGTDSLASNPSLSVLDEIRFLYRHLHSRFRRKPARALPDLFFRMATLNGAVALGFDHQVGSISPGKAADLIVLSLDVSRKPLNLCETLLASDSDPLAVFQSGVLRHTLDSDS